jgi:ribonuclease E
MRSLVISEYDNIAALMEDGKALEFFISKNEYGVGDIYTVTVENIMPSIDAVFVKLEEGRMGFLHANDVPGSGNLYDRLSPGQKLLVQIVKEPTGNKGPRVDFAISLPGRYFVLSTENKGISISRKISEGEERDRLKSIANLMKPEQVGIVIRTEASGRTQSELEEDFVNLWDTWRNTVDKHDRRDTPGLIHREQDFLYSTLRDYFNNTIDEIMVGNIQSRYRCEEFLKSWTGREVSVNNYDNDTILSKTGVEKELRNCLAKRVDLPSGGYIIIQTTEALTAVDINSGRFTSSNTLRETVRRTNMEAAVEIARQMRLRNIGGMIIVDFIDMPDRADRITVVETLESALKVDKAKPQVGQLSDLCLVEITRKRSGQSLVEVFGVECAHCSGQGIAFNLRGTHQQIHQQPQRPHHRHQQQRPHQQQRQQQQGGGSGRNFGGQRSSNQGGFRQGGSNRPQQQRPQQQGSGGNTGARFNNQGGGQQQQRSDNRRSQGGSSFQYQRHRNPQSAPNSEGVQDAQQPRDNNESTMSLTQQKSFNNYIAPNQAQHENEPVTMVATMEKNENISEDQAQQGDPAAHNNSTKMRKAAKRAMANKTLQRLRQRKKAVEANKNTTDGTPFQQNSD